MDAASFLRTALLIGTGPIVWAGHFLLIYGVTGVICARPPVRQEWLVTGIGTATIVALVMIAGVLLWSRRTRDDPAAGGFVRRTAESLGLLSGIAVVWETVPVFLVPACA